MARFKGISGNGAGGSRSRNPPHAGRESSHHDNARERGVCRAATGGFNCFVRHVQKGLDFDAVFANELVVDGGKLTGEVREPILTREDKLDALTSLAAKRDIPLRLTLAVGDGANDLSMLQAAGLGVAYHAKPAVAERVAHRLDYCDLTGLLYAQGYRASEFVAE